MLAGFHDGLADEGVGAGPASLVGLKIAHEQRWTAPDGKACRRPSSQPDGDLRRDGGRTAHLHRHRRRTRPRAASRHRRHTPRRREGQR